MREVAADADPLVMRLRRRAGRPRIAIAEGKAVVNVVGDRLHPHPAAGQVAEQPPRKVAQMIGLAVAAAEQVDERFGRQLVDRRLLGQRVDLVGFAVNPR